MYRKFKADQIFDGQDLLPANSVLITEESGKIIGITDVENAGDGIEHFTGILTPGFINCHCHLELSHLKGHIPKKTGLIDFLLKVVNERHFEEAEILSAIEKADSEMFSNGIVAIGDICNTNFSINQKLKTSIWYRNFIEVAGFSPDIAGQRFQRGVDIYNSFHEKFQENAIVPHAPYSVSAPLLKLINDFPGNDILTIHNQESAAENEFFQNKQGDFLRMYKEMNIDISFFSPTGKTSLQGFLPYLEKKRAMILVHNVATSLEDMHFADAQFSGNGAELYYCLCPNANLYIAGILPDIDALFTSGRTIVLGTDSLASNDQLNILEEIQTVHKNFPSIPMKNLLQWATINGAEALGCAENYGSFETGKTPGIILLDTLGNSSEISFSNTRRIL